MLCLSNHALTINTRVWQCYFRCLEQAHPATHPSTRSNGLSTIPEQLHNVEHGNARHVNYDSLLPYMKHAAHQRFSCTATFEWTQKCPTSKTVPTIAYLPSSVPGPHVSSHIPWAGRPLTDAALYAMCKTQQACLQGGMEEFGNQGSKAKRRLGRLTHDGHTALLPLALHSDRSRLFTKQ